MKYLLLIVVLVIAYMMWRNARIERKGPPSARPPGPADGPQEMVACAACGVHLPRTDALPGPDGRLYCCQDHRQRAGG
ncbi:MAG TPA: PP0621 family protein [Ramlibacter sp.]|uniref:PP0621 family protein n=1 Tax=Ramlibacter sp. TaxID=1917967 RepID=UPI002ECFB50E